MKLYYEQEMIECLSVINGKDATTITKTTCLKDFKKIVKPFSCKGCKYFQGLNTKEKYIECNYSKKNKR